MDSVRTLLSSVTGVGVVGATSRIISVELDIRKPWGLSSLDVEARGWSLSGCISPDIVESTPAIQAN